MYLVRILLVMLLTFSTSLSNAMDAGHMPVSDHTHATVEDMADAQPLCCQDSTEHAQTCHAPTGSFSHFDFEWHCACCWRGCVLHNRRAFDRF